MDWNWIGLIDRFDVNGFITIFHELFMRATKVYAWKVDLLTPPISQQKSYYSRSLSTRSTRSFMPMIFQYGGAFKNLLLKNDRTSSTSFSSSSSIIDDINSVLQTGSSVLFSYPAATLQWIEEQTNNNDFTTALSILSSIPNIHNIIQSCIAHLGSLASSSSSSSSSLPMDRLPLSCSCHICTPINKWLTSSTTATPYNLKAVEKIRNHVTQQFSYGYPQEQTMKLETIKGGSPYTLVITKRG